MFWTTSKTNLLFFNKIEIVIYDNRVSKFSQWKGKIKVGLQNNSLKTNIKISNMVEDAIFNNRHACLGTLEKFHW